MKTRAMSDLEKEVMSIIWSFSPCSIKDVKIRLDRKKRLAYTTISTLVQRLEKKGLLKRLNNCQGNCIKFSPKISKKEYSSILVKGFLSSFQKSFGDIAIASFADSIRSLSPEKREFFLKLLSDHD